VTVTNGYCTEDEVRLHLRDLKDKLDADLLDRAINAASRAIDKHTGRRFWPDVAPTTRVYRVDDWCHVDIDDVSTSAGFIVKTDPSLDGTFSETWDAADYQLEPLNGGVADAGLAWDQLVAIGTRYFPTHVRRATLQVTAAFGWSQIPDEVNTACILKSVSLFRRKDAPFGIAGMNEFGPVRITRRDIDVMELLAPFVRTVIV
jgi:hypothetical protein